MPLSLVPHFSQPNLTIPCWDTLRQNLLHTEFKLIKKRTLNVSAQSWLGCSIQFHGMSNKWILKWPTPPINYNPHQRPQGKESKKDKERNPEDGTGWNWMTVKRQTTNTRKHKRVMSCQLLSNAFNVTDGKRKTEWQPMEKNDKRKESTDSGGQSKADYKNVKQ